MKHILSILLFAALLAVASCSRTDDTRLAVAERQMAEHPDSALLTLRQIDATSLNRHNTALYALLLTQALDKNDVAVNNDSSIRIAVDYYSRYNDNDKKLRSFYYWGKTFVNSGNLRKATAAFAEAEQYVDAKTDLLMLGLLYSQLGDLYENYGDYQKSLSYFQKAYKAYLSKGAKRHSNFALYDIGCAYYNLMDHKNALIYWDKAKKLGKEEDDTIVIKDCLASELKYYVEQENFTIADSLLQELTNNYNTDDFATTFYCAVAAIASTKGDETHVDKMLDKAKNVAETPLDSLSVLQFTSIIDARLGDFKSAYYNIKNCYKAENKEIRKRLAQPLLTLQRDELAKEIEITTLQHKSKQMKLWLTMLVVAIILVIVVLYLWIIIKKKNREIENFQDLLFDLKSTFESNNNAKDNLLRELFKKKFKYLNEIGNSVFDLTDDPKCHKLLYREMKKLIERFRKDKNLQKELEILVDEYCNGVISKLRLELPELENDEIMQLCFHCAGFSGKLIGLIFKKSQANIYMRKTRLKKKILEFGGQSKDLILDCLEK